MLFVYIGAAILLLALIFLLISYICYRITFYAPPKRLSADASAIPVGDFMEKLQKETKPWVVKARDLPREEVTITSYDGLTLQGYYYEYAPGAPVEIMFHGYRGSAFPDMAGGIFRCFRVGRNALLVDHRSCGKSQGRTITFGAKEQKDCLAWVDFAIEKFGPDVKIILTGISMGAATVLLAGGNELPKNVIGILADCGYSSAEEIIKSVIKKMKLPVGLGYFFVKMGARIYGGFDLKDAAPEKALKNCTVPVFLIHGEEDSFVPCYMSRINYEACAGKKKLVTVPGGDHGMAYMADPERYIAELKAFFGPAASA